MSQSAATICVEFYGLPRERAGLASTAACGGNLGEVLSELERRFPELAADCLASGRLRSGYAANLNGQRFITASETTLKPGDTLLIMSADAGG